jgi:hypothetical protein
VFTKYVQTAGKFSFTQFHDKFQYYLPYAPTHKNSYIFIRFYKHVYYFLSHTFNLVTPEVHTMYLYYEISPQLIIYICVNECSYDYINTTVSHTDTLN